MSINVKSLATGIQSEITAWRRELHQCPEIKMDNPKTATIITKVLKEIGITDIRTGIGNGTGIAAVIHGDLPGKVLGIRADCDGLPVQEETGLSFASKNGNMHACGHDAHTAMALGVAKILYENKKNLRGSVKMIFQPGEEYGLGARLMTEDGVLENPHVDAIIGLHTGGLFEGFKPGEIGYVPEKFGFCVTTINAKFLGKGGHTSMQHKAHDAIMMACYAASQVQVVMSRERNVFKPAVISIGTIEGGQKNNIIASDCFLTGTIRSDNNEDQALYEKRVETIFRSVAESMGGSLEYNLPLKLRSTKINPEMLKKFLNSSEKVLPKENVKEIKLINTVGEDFSEFCNNIPAMFFFHCSTYGDERDYPHHHTKFDVNESALWSGTALLAQFAFDWQE